MKKKVLFALPIIMAGLGFAISNSYNNMVFAEEDPVVEPAPAFEEKTYTYTGEEGTSTIVLTSETEFTMVMVNSNGETVNGSGTYVREGNVITLTTVNGEMKISVDDETMTFGEYKEIYECSVVFDSIEHGTVESDILEGHVGEIVTIIAKHDLFYKIDYVSVNGVNLVEDENTSGLYQFVLVEGENKIAAKFIVDDELLGEMAIIYDQAANKDWANLFSVENIVRVISWLFSGGLLFAMVRYFIKDKRIANNVEKSIKEVCNEIIPETTKEVVLKQTEETLKPIFAKTAAYQEDIIRVLGILVKCVALMQEDTPDAKRAILAELANLNIGDMQVIENAKKFIDDYFNSKMSELQGTISKLDAVIEKNKEIANKSAEVTNSKEELPSENAANQDDGTQI